ERAEHFTTGGTDRSGTKQYASFRVLDDLDKAVVTGLMNPAPGGVRYLRPADADAEARLAGLGLRHADRTHLRIGERDVRDRGVVGRTAAAAQDVAHRDVGLVHGHVGELALAGDVADRPHAVGRAHPLVGGDEPGVLVQADRADA